MVSETRKECSEAVVKYSRWINSMELDRRGLIGYIGIAGDPYGGEYSYLFDKNKFDIKTIDADPKWNPDLVADISRDGLWTPVGNIIYFDVLVCVQVLEHVPYLWKVPYSFYANTSPGAYVIVDCPWMYPYHAEPPSFGDYWRITKDGFKILFDPYFEIVDITEGKHNTTCLLKRRSH